AGAAVAPLVVVVATYVNEPSTPFKELFYNVNLYTVLIIGAPLYGVVTTYLFNREYVENTIKNILTIPVSRVSFIMSKDRKSTRLNSSHVSISYAVFCL